jgi:hypothetical protein
MWRVWGGERRVQGFGGETWGERDHWGDPGIDGRITAWNTCGTAQVFSPRNTTRSLCGRVQQCGFIKITMKNSVWIKHTRIADSSNLWTGRGLGDTQRQASELISGPCLGAKARLLSFTRIQSRAVTGLLTGHNTLRRHFYTRVSQ